VEQAPSNDEIGGTLTPDFGPQFRTGDPASGPEVSETSSLAEAQRKMLEENKASIIQEWHGLTVGLKWIVPTTGDPYHRPVKDKRAAQLGVRVTRSDVV